MGSGTYGVRHAAAVLARSTCSETDIIPAGVAEFCATLPIAFSYFPCFPSLHAPNFELEFREPSRMPMDL